MDEFAVILKNANGPGINHTEIFKSFTSRERAENWLIQNGYKIKNNGYWEDKEDEDFWVWIYYEIKMAKVEN